MEKVSLLCGPLESQLIVKVQYKSEPKLAHSRQRDPGEVLLLDTFLMHETAHFQFCSLALWRASLLSKCNIKLNPNWPTAGQRDSIAQHVQQDVEASDSAGTVTDAHIFQI